MFITQLADTVYGRKIFLFIGTRQEFVFHLSEVWGKHASKGICKDACGQMHWFRVPSEYEGVKSRVYYLWSLRFNGSVKDIGTLAHEAFHVATTILCDLGVDTNDTDGSESVAYYMESIFTQSLEALYAKKEG